jgi:plasmid replication initiation protein
MKQKFSLKQVKHHNILTQARYDMSALEMDIVFLLLSKLDEDKRSKKLYRIPIDELEERAGKEIINVTRLRESTSKLRAREYTVVEEDGSYLQVGILASARYIKQDRILELELSMMMEQFLFDLRDNFTVYYLETALKLKSKYAKRIYQLLSQFRSTGFYRTTLKKLKEQLGLYDPDTGEEKYTEFTTFKRKVVEVAKKELGATDMNFTYKFMKEGRSYKWVEFYFTPLSKQPARNNKSPEPQQVLVYPKEEATVVSNKQLHPEENLQSGKRLLFDRMTDNFQLSPKQIAIIFENFNLKTVNKTLYDLQLEFNDKNVINKGAYSAKRFEMTKKGVRLSNADFIV